MAPPSTQSAGTWVGKTLIPAPKHPSAPPPESPLLQVLPAWPSPKASIKHAHCVYCCCPCMFYANSTTEVFRSCDAVSRDEVVADCWRVHPRKTDDLPANKLQNPHPCISHCTHSTQAPPWNLDRATSLHQETSSPPPCAGSPSYLNCVQGITQTLPTLFI